MLFIHKLFTFLLWFALSYRLNAYKIDVPLPPQGALGITLDLSLAYRWPEGVPTTRQDRRAFQWSSLLLFNGNVDQITEGQLWKIALDAHAEIEKDQSQYQIAHSVRTTPGAMTVLAWDRKILLASSQKNEPSFTMSERTSPVQQSLRICQMVWRDAGYKDDVHRSKGKCGEPMAVHLWYAVEGLDSSIRNANARIGTVVSTNPIKTPVHPTSPCMNLKKKEWGCGLFVADQSLNVIDRFAAVEDYDLTTIAGGLASRGQVGLCGGVRVFDE